MSLGRHAWPLVAFGVGAAALLLLLGLGVPAAAFQGWLVAFAFWSAIPIGALVLTLVHLLTGGRWEPAPRPPRWHRPIRSVPLLGLFFLPLCFGLGHLYPWASDPGAVAGASRGCT